MKNKEVFWFLAGIFSLWCLAFSALLWVTHPAGDANHHTQMMGDTMANMMKHHGEVPATLQELVIAGDTGMQSNTTASTSHHSGNGIMGIVHILTTSIIYIACPFIIAGAVFILINRILI